MIFGMNHIIGCKDTHCSFCFRKTDVEYIDFHNDDGCIVFAIHVCKDCAKDLKNGIADLFKEGESNE